jgi:predicted secreted protein
MSQALRDRVAEFLKRNPNRWIAATSFEPVGGRQAWRTRLSECRVLGMTIENRVRTITRDDGSKYKLSEYRYVPPSQPEQQRLSVMAQMTQ